MITEDYVSFETAKLLKEKGFDESISMVYTSYGDLCKLDRYDSIRNSNYNDITKNYFEYTAPTLQMAMKWLREAHKLGVFPSTYSFMVGENGSAKHAYGTAIINLETYELMTPDMMPMPTCEEACEVAIKYCLENLI